MKREILFTHAEIQQRVIEISSKIEKDYIDKESPIMVCVLNGGVFFFTDLCKNINMFNFKIDFIRASSYGTQMTSSGFIKFTKDVDYNIKGKTIIVVEDIIDNGLTMYHIIRRLKRDGAKEVKVCALISKTIRRKYEVNIDYCGFEINDGFLIGYGMDNKEYERNLNHIYILKD